MKKGFIIKNYADSRTEKLIKLRRKIQNTNNKIIKIILINKYNKIQFELNSFYPLSTSISNNITFPHGICGIYVSNGAKIGDNCVIFHQVTIGSNSLSDSKTKGSPIIGKNCYIGAGAKIIGNVTIGDNVRIGANTVVTKNVPSNTTVVGQEFRVIRHNHKLDNSFIPYGKS